MRVASVMSLVVMATVVGHSSPPTNALHRGELLQHALLEVLSLDKETTKDQEESSRSYSKVDRDIVKSQTDDIDYVLELVSERLKEEEPIWMKFEEKLFRMIIRGSEKNYNCSKGITLEECNTNKEENRSNNVSGSFTPEEDKTSSLASSLKNDSDASVTDSFHANHVNGSCFIGKPEDYNSHKRQKSTRTPKKKRAHNWLSSIHNNQQESGNVAAIPLRIVRNGRISLRKGRGFLTGVVPLRIAPIKLVPANNLKQVANFILRLKARARFNFFKESGLLDPEIYVAALRVEQTIKIVPQRLRRRKISDRLRNKFHDVFEANLLREKLQNNTKSILQEVLKEENSKGSFIIEF